VIGGTVKVGKEVEAVKVEKGAEEERRTSRDFEAE
jgi:hypothetical protein